MKVEVYLHATSFTPESLRGKVVVVTDVFRATTVIVTAITAGASAVIPVAGIEEALVKARGYDRDKLLLGGERNAVKIEGFDLDNSPLSYTPDIVAGKTIVLSTTNGTRAICNSGFSDVTYIGCFNNISAVCRAAAMHGRDIVILCSGRQNRFTMEDGLFAGAAAGMLSALYGYGMSDLARAMNEVYDRYRSSLQEILKGTVHYGFLMESGFEKDVEYSLLTDILDTVPVFCKKDNIIRATE